MEQPEPFRHPLLQLSYFERAGIVVSRFFHLAVCFVPFAALSVVYLLDKLLLKNERLRGWWLQSLLHSFETAGCSFQKFGQWMSMRPDMLPIDVIQTLSRLRHSVGEHDMQFNRQAIEDQLGLPLEAIFEQFSEAPIASGTVAQVHRARLRPHLVPQGESGEVAVKIRHPHVLKETFVDLDLIFLFINSLGEVAGHLTIPFKKEDFHWVLQRQVDFRWEAYNIIRFTQNFWNELGEDKVGFPSVVQELSTAGILVETWVPGRTIADYFSELGEFFVELPVEERIKNYFFTPEEVKNKKALARNIFDCSMKMFLRDNLIHGDLHAGNILFSSTNKAYLIDAGVVTSVEPQFRDDFNKFFCDCCTGNSEGVTEGLIKFNSSKLADMAAFKEDIEKTTRRWVGEPGRNPQGGQVSIGDLLGEVLFKIQKHHLHLRGDVASTIVTMSLIEGLIKQLDPDFDIVGDALKYFKTYHPQSLPNSR